MAKKKRRKKHRLRNLCVFIVFPLAVWFIAFVLWLFWYEIAGVFPQAASRPSRVRRAEKLRPPSTARPDEKILNEDRKRLQDIIDKRH